MPNIHSMDHDRGIATDTTQGMGTAEIAQLAADGWVEVTDVERDAVCRHRPIFNGCTSVYLKEHYGTENIKRVIGINWFRRVTAMEAADQTSVSS